MGLGKILLLKLIPLPFLVTFPFQSVLWGNGSREGTNLKRKWLFSVSCHLQVTVSFSRLGMISHSVHWRQRREHHALIFQSRNQLVGHVMGPILDALCKWVFINPNGSWCWELTLKEGLLFSGLVVPLRDTKIFCFRQSDYSRDLGSFKTTECKIRKRISWKR